MKTSFRPRRHPRVRSGPAPRRAGAEASGPTGSRPWLILGLAAGSLVVAPGCAPVEAAAQTPLAHTDSATVQPGDYGAGGLHRALMGSGYRDLWTTGITVPVLDLDRFAGGLTPEDRGGTSQSIVLHMRGADGREWHFRSVDKDVSQGLPDALVGTFLGGLVQDQISTLHPGAAFVVAPLMEAAGLLHADPRLVRMPDHPRLGRFREQFAGMLGMIVERPNEGENDEVLFGGSEKIVGMDEMLERLEESGDHLVDAREFLTARLVDILVGDTDRGHDQWRWARYGEEGAYTWRPIARDRDWAFVSADGLFPGLVRRVYPKVGRFHREYGSLSEYVFMSSTLDRPLLAGLDRAAFDEVAGALRSALTDAVIAEAVSSMPEPFVARQGEALGEALRQRRDRLGEIAAEFYEWLSPEVAIDVSDEAEHAEFTRMPDGAVELRIRRVGPGEDSLRTVRDREVFRRTFLPAETREIRLDLHGGDDVAVIRGHATDAIVIRIEGGGDNDLLADSTAPGGADRLYDARGDNAIEAGQGTHVDRRDFDAPEASGAWPAEKIAGPFKDWGGSSGIAPTGRYRSGAGAILGLRRTWTKYGFRRIPYAHQYRIAALVATADWEPGVEASARFRAENAPYGFSVGGRAVGYHTVRWYGLGNDSPEPEFHGSRLVRQEEYRAAAHAEAFLPGGLTLSAGPFVRYTEVVSEDSTAPIGLLTAAEGRGPFGTVGAEVAAGFVWTTGGAPSAGAEAPSPEGPDAAEAGEVGIEDLSGDAPEGGDSDHDSHSPEEILDALVPTVRLESSLGGSWVPALWDAQSAFGEAHAIARARMRFGERGPELGLRVGGQRVWGDFPFHEAAFVGGLRSLRGFRTYRFAGDASAYGTAELGVPLFDMELLLRGTVGVFGLVDVGRVWVDGASPGGWHNGVGGGISFRSLGRVVRASVIRGEGTRMYVDFGWP